MEGKQSSRRGLANFQSGSVALTPPPRSLPPPPTTVQVDYSNSLGSAVHTDRTAELTIRVVFAVDVFLSCCMSTQCSVLALAAADHNCTGTPKCRR